MKDKKVLLITSIVIGIAFLVLLGFQIFNFTTNYFTLDSTIEQVDDAQTINVSWETSKPIDRIEITVKHNGVLYTQITKGDAYTLAKGSLELDVFYGKLDVEVKGYKGLLNTSTEKKEVKVFTDEYNIASLSGTMPVTLFSLELSKINQIPTFVWLKRSDAWDWSQLPQNVYASPVATYDEIQDSNSILGHAEMFDETTKWIKELYEINPSSKFNLYYNDYHLFAAIEATVGNGLPKDAYHLNLLSDGDGSFKIFNALYDNETPQSVYDAQLAKYEKLKTQVAKRGSYTQLSIGYEIIANDSKDYSYVMAYEEENVDLWLTRMDGTLNTTDEFYNKFVDKECIKVKDLNTTLNGMTDEEQDSLQKLYNFSSSFFSKAEEEGKKVMMILGTWTQNEHDFIDYVNYTKTLYGNDYIYYYKGHPKNPTINDADKIKLLASLDLIDVDATIPAELIFFFNQDIFLTGYGSSTFQSVDPEQSLAVWGSTYETTAEGYRDVLSSYISKITTNEYDHLIVKNNTKYVIEYNPNNDNEYDLSIFDATLNKITNYKLVDGQYQIV